MRMKCFIHRLILNLLFTKEQKEIENMFVSVKKNNHLVVIEEEHAEIFCLFPYNRLGTGHVDDRRLVTEVTLPPDVVEAVDNEIEEEVIRVGEAAARAAEEAYYKNLDDRHIHLESLEKDVLDAVETSVKAAATVWAMAEAAAEIAASRAAVVPRSYELEKLAEEAVKLAAAARKANDEACKASRIVFNTLCPTSDQEVI